MIYSERMVRTVYMKDAGMRGSRSWDRRLSTICDTLTELGRVLGSGGGAAVLVELVLWTGGQLSLSR